MPEESVPLKKAARKTSRKRSTSKKSAKKTASANAEETAEAITTLSRESISGAKSASEPASKPDKGEKTLKKGPKTRVRDARKELSDEEILALETSEPLIKEIHEEAPKNEASGEKSDPEEKSERDGRNNNRRSRGRNRGRGGDGSVQPRVEINPEKLSKKAWKIFVSEVTEEGLALLDDRALRDYARSSLNAARIFLEENHKAK